MDLKNIKKLIELLEQSQISELIVEDEGVKVSLKKHLSAPEVKVTQVPIPHTVTPAAETPPATEKKTGPEAGLTPVISPIVGTFYRAPSPDTPPYVEVGDHIKPGQPVCIIEAMKMFNEIEAEISGRVVKILAGNGEAVEYGQVLMLIEEEK